MEKLKLKKELLIKRARDLEEISRVIYESKKTINKLYVRRKKQRYSAIAIALFAFPEPIITDIIGALLLALSFSGKRMRIDEIIAEELAKLKLDFYRY